MNVRTHPDYRLTLKEIAKILGISPTRVMQIEQQALRKMRAAAEARGLDLEDLLFKRDQRNYP